MFKLFSKKNKKSSNEQRSIETSFQASFKRKLSIRTKKKVQENHVSINSSSSQNSNLVNEINDIYYQIGLLDLYVGNMEFCPCDGRDNPEVTRKNLIQKYHESCQHLSDDQKTAHKKSRDEFLNVFLKISAADYLYCLYTYPWPQESDDDLRMIDDLHKLYTRFLPFLSPDNLKTHKERTKWEGDLLPTLPQTAKIAIELYRMKKVESFYRPAYQRYRMDTKDRPAAMCYSIFLECLSEQDKSTLARGIQQIDNEFNKMYEDSKAPMEGLGLFHRNRNNYYESDDPEQTLKLSMW